MILLSFAAGSTDGIAFLALSGVFTSAMSGNTILLGLAIGQGHFAAALHSLIAILGYVAGVSLASLSLAKLGRGSGWTLSLEALFLAAFAAIWFFFGASDRAPILYGLIVLSAIAMGLQGAIGRSLGVPGVMTVIFTSTYTAIVGDFIARALSREKPLLTGLAARQISALAAYLGGAAVAGAMTIHWLQAAPFLPLTAVLMLLAGLRLRLIRFPT